LKKVLLVFLSSTTAIESADTPSLDEVAQKGETGLLELDADLAVEAQRAGFAAVAPAQALAALEEHHRVFTRLDADSAAALEEIDRHFFAPLARTLRLADQVIAVAGGTGAGPLPLLITSDGLEPEGALEFGEREAARGRLGKLRGSELVPRLIEIAKS